MERGECSKFDGGESSYVCKEPKAPEPDGDWVGSPMQCRCNAGDLRPALGT
jgi:hypothetical protein